MDSIIGDLLDYGAQLHAQHDHPDTALDFARRLGVHVLAGELDSANAGPPAVITYNAALGTHRRRFGLWHEVAHVVMAWHGTERHYERELGDEAHLVNERIANLLAGVFMIPQPVMADAVRRYGHTPAAILHLQHVTRMREAVCLRRFTFDDPHASRAAAIISGSYVHDVAALNFRMPFQRFDRVPEPGQVMRDARLQAGRGRRVVAVWEG